MKIFGLDSADTLRSLKGVFSDKFISSIKEKKLSIPESLIQSKLREELENENIKLKGLNCTSEGMTVEVDAEKYGAKVHYAAFLRLSELKINPSEHFLIIDVKDDHLEGTNLRGKILSVLVNIIVDDIVEKAVSMSRGSSNVFYDDTCRKATVDLIGINAIAKLYKPLLFNKAPIDLAEVKGVSHASGSIIVHCDYGFH